MKKNKNEIFDENTILLTLIFFYNLFYYKTFLNSLNTRDKISATVTKIITFFIENYMKKYNKNNSFKF